MGAWLAVASPTPGQILSVLQEFCVFIYTILKIHILKYRLKLCNFGVFIHGLGTALFSHMGHPKTLPKLVTPHKSSSALAAPHSTFPAGDSPPQDLPSCTKCCSHPTTAQTSHPQPCKAEGLALLPPGLIPEKYPESFALGTQRPPRFPAEVWWLVTEPCAQIS